MRISGRSNRQDDTLGTRCRPIRAAMPHNIAHAGTRSWVAVSSAVRWRAVVEIVDIQREIAPLVGRRRGMCVKDRRPVCGWSAMSDVWRRIERAPMHDWHVPRDSGAVLSRDDCLRCRRLIITHHCRCDLLQHLSLLRHALFRYADQQISKKP